MTSALVPFDQLQQMGAALARSGLFGMKSTEQAIALMLVAQAEGQHPATIAQDYDIISGKATRKTHSVLARFQSAGGSVEWHELTAEVADATFRHPQGGSLRMVWTIGQAKASGLTGKDNWKNYPRAMLRARCIAEGVRAVYPAAIGGMLVAEEAQDLPPQRAAQTTNAATVDMGAAVEVAPDELTTRAAAAAEEGTSAYMTFWSGATKAERRLLLEVHGELKDRAAQVDASRTVVDADGVMAEDAQ